MSVEHHGIGMTSQRTRNRLANTLADMGIEYLLDSDSGGIKSDASAIRAIKEGTDLERKSLGISEWLRDITSIKDSQLLKLVDEYESDNEDIIDAEFEEPVVEKEE